MSSLRYWLCSLIGVAVATVAVWVVSLSTWALARTNECRVGDTRDWCELSGADAGIAIGVMIFVVIPIASWIFALRTKPRSSHLGGLAIGLSLLAGGGAALWAAGGTAPATDTTELVGLGIAVPALIVGVVFTLTGMATMGRRTSRAQARKAGEAVLAANGGDLKRSLAAVKAAQGQQRAAGGTAAAQPKQIQLGALAAQLSQIANASQRTGGDELAAKLRQLDDLRKSGLLSAEEHTRKRRELLDRM